MFLIANVNQCQVVYVEQGFEVFKFKKRIPNSIGITSNRVIFLISPPPPLRAPYSVQSVRGIFSLLLAQSGSYFTHRLPMDKVCAVNLHKICRSRSYFIRQCFFRAYIYSPLTLLGSCFTQGKLLS